MSGALQQSDGGGAVAACIRCGKTAAGPCARCHQPVCGDCCVLTEGGARVWAICFACEDRGGRSLSRGWLVVLGWIAGPILALALVIVILAWLTGR